MIKAKKEDSIPVGTLCFDTSIRAKNGVELNRCPYWKWYNGEGYCSYLDSAIELEYEQVKKCGINLDEKEKD